MQDFSDFSVGIRDFSVTVLGEKGLFSIRSLAVRPFDIADTDSIGRVCNLTIVVMHHIAMYGRDTFFSAGILR